MPLPAPVTWTDGEETDNTPTADELNLEWRDSFNFFLGLGSDPRPIGRFTGNTAHSLSTTFVDVALDTELLKKNLTHSTSTNKHLVTVPYTGQYQGYAWAGWNSLSTASMRCILRVMRNGSTLVAKMDNGAQNTTQWVIHGSWTANLTAGDTISMQMGNSTGTATAATTSTVRPNFGIWFAGQP